jgi:hypothetical protein
MLGHTLVLLNCEYIKDVSMLVNILNLYSCQNIPQKQINYLKKQLKH